MAMRHLALLATGVFLIAVSGPAVAGPFPAAGIWRGESQIVLVQDKAKKNETLKAKVKRVWRDLTGYKFAVACPAFPITLSQSTCTETGKNRADARAKCQSRHAFCRVADAR